MKKVCVIGHFGFGKNLLNGQTIKTKIITKALEEKIGENEVVKIDTHGGVKSLLKAPFQVIKALVVAKNVIILPANNGLRVYVPLLTIFRCFYKNRGLHYVVIGGWLAHFLRRKRMLAGQLKKFDGVYVETRTMKKDLEKMGFEQVELMSNCKALVPLKEEELVYPTSEPYRLCTFSRVMIEKGIEDAVAAINLVNEHFGRAVFELDIYGEVDNCQVDWFEELQNRFPQGIRYCGVVSFDKSVDTLKDYFALLFPTRFYTEGIPGTIIDAYAAGVPVISARWESFADVIDEGITGIGYEFGNVKDLNNVLIGIVKEKKEQILDLKRNCLNRSRYYLPTEVLEVVLKRLK